MSKDETLPDLPRFSESEMAIEIEEKSEADFKVMIRALHLKVTPQRLLILRCLHEGRRHLTAQELYEKVSVRSDSIGFATVYRFLRSLTEGNFVTEVRTGGSSARYELTPQSHHDHLTCTGCGKIVEFENRAIEAMQERVAQQFGFRLTHHLLELYGVCSTCSSKKK